MNSIELGNALEHKIFDFFQSEINDDRFIFRPECCRIFRKKGYYSKDRQKNIVFDLSVEVYLPGSTDYSLIMLIECKNYNHAVPVDDAEEFFAKLQQVSGANAKGIIAATNTFQEGTLAFCKSKGIGLLRYFDEADIKWVLNRSPAGVGLSDLGISDPREIHQGLTRSTYVSSRFRLFCCNGNDYTNSGRKLFHSLARTHLSEASLAMIESPKRSQPQFVEFLPKDEIERRANTILKIIKYSEGEVDLNEVCDQQKKEAGLTISFEAAQSCDKLTTGILGRIRFDPPIITVYRRSDENRGRERFTLAHELGHLFLDHSRYLRAEYCEADDFEIDDTANFGDIRSLEWQANYFASCLLLPRRSLLKTFWALARAHGLRDRGYGPLFVDEQPCNRANYYLITNQIKSMFLVSRVALKLRLQEVGLLNDVRGKEVLAQNTIHRTAAVEQVNVRARTG